MSIRNINSKYDFQRILINSLVIPRNSYGNESISYNEKKYLKSYLWDIIYFLFLIYFSEFKLYTNHK